MAHPPEGKTLVLTVGHSNRTFDLMVEILQSHQVVRVVDVRSVPRSRHNPQFNLEPFSKGLEQRGIAYLHLSGLGGFRRPRPDSANLGWRSGGFRGYADYMATEEFRKNLDQLVAMAGKEQVAILCAEANPFRCHRQLISDALLVLVRGLRVEHILDRDRREVHRLTPWAVVRDKTLIYPMAGAGEAPLADWKKG